MAPGGWPVHPLPGLTNVYSFKQGFLRAVLRRSSEKGVEGWTWGLTAPFGSLAPCSISEPSSSLWPEEALLTFTRTRSLPTPPECCQLGSGKGRGAQAGWARDDQRRARAAARERALWAEVALAHGQPHLLPVTARELTVPLFLIFSSSKVEIIVDFGGGGGCSWRSGQARVCK